MIEYKYEEEKAILSRYAEKFQDDQVISPLLTEVKSRG